MLARAPYLQRKPVLHFFQCLCATSCQPRMASNSLLNLSSSSLPPPHNIFWWNSAICGSFRSGNMGKARQLFDEMPHKNLVTWNCMISGYVRNNRLDEAQWIFNSMPQKNIVSWTALMTGYVRCGRLEEARDLFDRIPERNVICWNSMISGYISNREISKARALFEEMPTKNSVSWAIMIAGYLQHKHLVEAQTLFERAPLRETSIYNALLAGYVELRRFGDAENLFAQMTQRNIVSWNTMIMCYSQEGKVELARCLFEQMPEKDVISWTTLIHGYLQNGNIEVACKLFDEMPIRDIVAWNTMMGGFIQNGMLKDALRLFYEMPQRDIVSWNTILQGYVQCEDMVNACAWFERMPRRSETSWNTLISGYRSEEALALFSKMVREGFKPDQPTFAVVISVCASLVALSWGKMVHLYAIRSGYDHNTLVRSSLITMYSRCGLIGDSAQLFDCILRRDTISWNAMIATYAYHGFAREAFQLFDRMVKAAFEPDQVTFLALLSACAHKGLVDEGCRFFRSMQKDWNLVPRPEHCSCVVDLLGRSGFISQAFDFTNKLQLELQTNAWETLLSACRFHGNLEVGELAAKRVIHAQPFDGGMYIILSNIYAAKGMWEDSTRIRALMKGRGVRKETGCSWIEVKGNIYSFASNDKTHPHMDEIHRELDNLSLIMDGID